MAQHQYSRENQVIVVKHPNAMNCTQKGRGQHKTCKYQLVYKSGQTTISISASTGLEWNDIGFYDIGQHFELTPLSNIDGLAHETEIGKFNFTLSFEKRKI